MNCGMECVKYLLFIFNFVFALGGLALLILGVLLHTGLNGAVHLDNVDVPNIGLPAILMIIIGAIIFIIAFFGCCGAIRESHCMIVTFAIMLLTLLVIQIAIAIYGFVILDKDKVKTAIQSGIQTGVNKYYTGDNDSKDRISIDSIQLFTHCCGYNSYTDYYHGGNQRIPYSCCGNDEKKDCNVNQVQGVPGCKDEFWTLVEKYSRALGGLAIGIAVVELIGVIFSFCLANSIRNVERRGYKV